MILLIGWLLVWEALIVWAKGRQQPWRQLLGYTVVAAMSTASIFLLHFRVAAFYLPLVALIALWMIWISRRERSRLTQVIAGVVAVGGLSLLLVMPVLVDAMQVYVEARSTPVVVRTANPEGGVVSNYFQFPLSSFPYLIGASTWFLGLAVAALVVGLIRRCKLALASLFWLICLFGLGYAYLLGIRLLNLTNLGAVLIMLYLPIGIVVGTAVPEILRLLRGKRAIVYGVSAFFLIAGILAAPARATTIEAYRYFVTPADVAAMDWINIYTEPDALFAVNTHFWLPGAPHGTDAGYWIPYFTGRPTTASVMIFSSLASREYRAKIVAVSQEVERLETDPFAVAQLAELGVDYIFIGQVGDFASSGLQADLLREQNGLEEVYRNEGSSIFRLADP